MIFSCRNSRNTLNLILLALALLVIPACSNKSKDLVKTLKGFGLNADGIEGFVIKESIDGLTLAERGDEIIRIKAAGNLEKDAAEKSVKEQTKLLAGIFDAQLPPYPEFLTKEIGCAERFRPKRKETPIGFYQMMLAGKRLTYGVCVDDLAFYIAGQGFFYLPAKKQLLKIEYFIPKHMAQEKIDGFFNSLRVLP